VLAILPQIAIGWSAYTQPYLFFFLSIKIKHDISNSILSFLLFFSCTRREREKHYNKSLFSKHTVLTRHKKRSLWVKKHHLLKILKSNKTKRELLGNGMKNN
jgi:hypothetical protein